MNDSLIIRVLKFNTFNPRKDRVKHSWFRVENDIPFSDSLEGLDPDQKWFWLCLVAWTSKKQGEPIDYNLKYFVKHTGVSEKKIKAAIFHFQKSQMIEVLPRAVTAGLPSGDITSHSGVTTNERTDEQTNVTNEQTMNFNFEAFYEAYKNRVNKAEGFRRLHEQINTQQDYDDFAKAIPNYNRYLELSWNNWLSPKQWDVFIGTKSGKQPWRDWVDPHPSVYEDPKSKKSDDIYADIKKKAVS